MQSGQYILVFKAHPLFGIVLTNHFNNSKYPAVLIRHSETIISSTEVEQSLISEILKRRFEKNASSGTLGFIRYFLGDSTQTSNTAHPHDKQLFGKLYNDSQELISLVRDFVIIHICYFLFPYVSEYYLTANGWKILWFSVNDEIHSKILYHNQRYVDSNHKTFFNLN